MSKQISIKEARQACGLSRKEAADRMLIPYRTLEDWEQGKSSISPYDERWIRNEYENLMNPSGAVLEPAPLKSVVQDSGSNKTKSARKPSSPKSQFENRKKSSAPATKRKETSAPATKRKETSAPVTKRKVERDQDDWLF